MHDNAQGQTCALIVVVAVALFALIVFRTSRA